VVSTDTGQGRRFDAAFMKDSWQLNFAYIASADHRRCEEIIAQYYASLRALLLYAARPRP